jgi:signal transduction histidine kinase
MSSEWLTPAHWETPPSALQCMLLARVAEEALTNIVKHSQARMVRVNLLYPDARQLVLRIEDDGIGF